MTETLPFSAVLAANRDRGRYMARRLEHVFSALHFPIELIKKHGVLCTNVGDGPEIVAFDVFSPSVLYAAEPIVMPNDYTADEPIKAQVLNTFAQDYRNVRLIRYDDSIAIEKVKKEVSKVAVVTQLNFIPGTLNINFIYSALGIVISNGLVLVSTQNSDDEEELTRYANRHLKDLKANVLTAESSSFLAISNS